MAWNNIPYNQRLCMECNTIGDGFHALLECKRFSTRRKKSITDYFFKRLNVIKFDQLMNNTDFDTLKKMFFYYIHLKE